MNKKTLLLILLMAYAFELSGQWYYKKYNVNDINDLTRNELTASMQNTKEDILYSGCVTALGGLFIVMEKYFPYEESEDPTFFETLMGEKGMNTLYKGLGYFCFTGGIIVLIERNARLQQIKSTLRRNFPGTSNMIIRPEIYHQPDHKKYSAGLKMTLNF